MSALTNFGEELALKWLFTTSSATRPTAWHVALHTASPGEAAGAGSEVTTGIDPDYVRKTMTFADPVAASGQVVSTAAASWTVNAGSGGYTVTHISINDAATSGNRIMYGALPVPRILAAGNVLSFSIGDIIAALD
jgi:hypothetical protein